MIVKKFRGASKEEAEKKAKQSMGEDAIILMNKLVKKKGLFSSGKAYEVTAATDESKKEPAVKQQVNDTQSGDMLSLSFEAKKQMGKAPQAPVFLEEESDEEDKALEALRRRRSGKLEIKETPIVNDVTLTDTAQIKDYIKQEIINAHQSVEPEKVQKENSPFLTFLGSRGMQTSTAASIDEKLSTFFGNVNLSSPSDERTECFKMLKREILARLSVHGPICLDRYRTSYACFIGDPGAGKFLTAAKLAIQYTVALEKRVGVITLGKSVDSQPLMTLDLLKSKDVAYRNANSLKELSDAVDELSNCDLVLLCYEKDLSAYNDRSFIEGIEHLLSGVSFHLVVNGSKNYRSLESTIREYSDTRVDSLVVTHLDKLSKLGILVDLCTHTQIPLSYLSNGFSVPEDLKVADQQDIARKILLDESYSTNKMNMSKTA